MFVKHNYKHFIINVKEEGRVKSDRAKGREGDWEMKRRKGDEVIYIFSMLTGRGRGIYKRGV